MAILRKCRVCGCHDRSACWGEETGACWWVEDDLCSACSGDQPDASRDEPIDRLTCDGDTFFGTGDPVNLQGSGPAPIVPREG